MQKVLDKPLTTCYIKYVEWLRDKSIMIKYLPNKVQYWLGYAVGVIHFKYLVIRYNKNTS